MKSPKNTICSSQDSLLKISFNDYFIRPYQTYESPNKTAVKNRVAPRSKSRRVRQVRQAPAQCGQLAACPAKRYGTPMWFLYNIHITGMYMYMPGIYKHNTVYTRYAILLFLFIYIFTYLCMCMYMYMQVYRQIDR